MPWRKYTSDWIAALTGRYRATTVGSEPESGYLVVQVDKPVADGVLKVDLPCGQQVSGRPAWTRRGTESTTLVGFDSESLGVTDEAMDGLCPVPETRGSPRVPARLWVSFPEEPFRGTVTSDLSLGGCRLEGDFRDCIGRRLNLYLDLYDSCDPLQVRAQVVWSDSSQAGLRFLNLHVADEVRLLRSLGRATTVAPSRFLPTASARCSPYSYRMETEGKVSSLFVSVTNWNVRFDLQEVVARGPQSGVFKRFQLLHNSEDIHQARSRLKLSLGVQRQFVHLVLLDEEDDVVFEIIGEEVGFHREERQEKPEMGEVAS